jgi:hypothetical protein
VPPFSPVAPSTPFGRFPLPTLQSS